MDRARPPSSGLDARQPAVQVLGREITIEGFTVTGGFFGIAVNRGGTALIDNNTIEGAAHSGVEVSQNSFARVVNNTIRRNRQNGVLVLGSASVHIGVVRSDDELPKPNIIEDNDGDGIHVIRASTARIIGNTLSGNRGSGLACATNLPCRRGRQRLQREWRARDSCDWQLRVNLKNRDALVRASEHDHDTKRIVWHPLRVGRLSGWHDRKSER